MPKDNVFLPGDFFKGVEMRSIAKLPQAKKEVTIGDLRRQFIAGVQVQIGALKKYGSDPKRPTGEAARLWFKPVPEKDGGGFVTDIRFGNHSLLPDGTHRAYKANKKALHAFYMSFIDVCNREDLDKILLAKKAWISSMMSDAFKAAKSDREAYENTLSEAEKAAFEAKNAADKRKAILDWKGAQNKTAA